jgi:hypothetical protein
MDKTYHFKSDRWDIEPGEDDDINPRMYGRQLAHWLEARLEERGYDIEIVDEDWGRCLTCAHDSFRLFVGCGSQLDYHKVEVGAPPPRKEDVVWVAFASVELPLLKRLFGRVDPASDLRALDAALKSILDDAGVTFIDE